MAPVIYHIRTKADTHTIYRAIKREMMGARFALTKEHDHIIIHYTPCHEENIARLWHIVKTFEHKPWYKRIMKCIVMHVTG